jgi:hypothetical protein
MKKLVIAVIVLSIFGFGPLQSYFQSGGEKEGEKTKSIPFLEKLKGSSESDKGVETYLIMENSKGSSSSAPEPGLLIKYDKVDNKMEFGSILVRHVAENDELESLKKEVSQKYQVEIDYGFIFDFASVGTTIDLLAPNGIEMKNVSEGHFEGERKILKGEDFVFYLEQLKSEPDYVNQVSTMFTALKAEIMKEISVEKILTLAPQVMDETLKNVHTDIGKSKLMDLGLSMMMNPVTSIEQVDLMTINRNKIENVNKMLDGEQARY